jgi:hypothetical protein
MAASAGQVTGEEREVYEAGAGRKTFLSLAFLILLPFYASLGPMLGWRFVHGLWFDTVGLIAFALIFTALMTLLGLQIYQSLRSRVILGKSAVRITLPQGSGAMPMLRFIDREVPYDQIQAIETRCVLFGNSMAPVLLRATRLLISDGAPIRLGTVNEDNVDQALPFPEIGRKIAERAGVNIVDGGMVRRSIERRILGFLARKTTPENSPPLTEAELKTLQSRHKRAKLYLIAGATILVLGGVAVDVLTAPRTSFATSGAPAAASKR